MSYFAQLARPFGIDPSKVDVAIEASIQRIFFGNMTRQQAARRAAGLGDLRKLPLGHLLDQRLTGTVLPPMSRHGVREVKPSDWSRCRPAVEHRLERLLIATDRPGALPPSFPFMIVEKLLRQP